MYSTARIEIEKCSGCKLCILSCPDPNVLIFTSNKRVAINESRCKGCGLCAYVCPKQAITVKET